MSLLTLIPAFVLAASASFASNITNFNCALEKYPKDNFVFQMKNLGQKNMTFVNKDNEEYGSVFTTRSKNETVKRLVDTLNGQGGDLRNYADRIEFFGDSAGIDFANLVLYKNTKYTRGYVRIDFDFNNDKQYSKVLCSTSQK